MPHLVLHDRKARLFRRVLVAAAEARPEVSWPIRQLIDSVDRMTDAEMTIPVVRVDGIRRKAALSAILEYLTTSDLQRHDRDEVVDILRGCLGEIGGWEEIEEVIGDVTEYREKRAATEQAIAHEVARIREREERRFAEGKKTLTDRQERDRRRPRDPAAGPGTRPEAQPGTKPGGKPVEKRKRERKHYAWDLTD